MNLAVLLLAVIGGGWGWVAGNVGPGSVAVSPTTATRMWSLAAGSASFTVLAVAAALGLPTSLLPLLAAGTAMLLLLAVCDAVSGTIPDRLPATTALAVGLLIAGTAVTAPGIGSLRWMAIGAGVFAALFAGLWFFSDARMVGGGDVRVAPIIGAVAGFAAPSAVTLSLVAAFASGGHQGSKNRSQREL